MSGPATYTCALCRGTFYKCVSDAAAEVEYRALFPDEAATGAPRDVVCDDCFRLMGLSAIVAAETSTYLLASEESSR